MATSRHTLARTAGAAASIAAMTFVVFGSSPALADQATNGCMREIAGFNLGCTSNDVRIAGVARNPDGSPKLTVIDPTSGQPLPENKCAYKGADVTFKAEFDLVLSAQTRYDIGIYFATDGDLNDDGAVSGSCDIVSLDKDNSTPFIQLDPPQDACGDINAANSPLRPEVTLTTACIDDDENGQLDLPYCLSWRQPGSNELCAGPLDAFPGSPSKCKCDKAFNVPIAVPRSTISVTKTPSVDFVDETGGPVTYTAVVTNNGIDPNNPFTVTSLVDNVFGDLNAIDGSCKSAVPFQLGSGASRTCTFTATVNGSAKPNSYEHVNKVTASGADARGNTNSAEATATVIIRNVKPSISVTKDADKAYVLEPGGNVTYTVKVTNNGNTFDPVKITNIADDHFSSLNSDCSTIMGQFFALGASKTCTFTKYVTGPVKTTHTNKVTVDVVDDDDDTASASDTADVEIRDVKPTIAVTKTPSPGTVDEPGGNVTFTVRITNESLIDDVFITSLADDTFGNLDGKGTCAVPVGGIKITKGGSNYYECSFTGYIPGDVGGSHVNTITAQGKDDDDEAVWDTGSATVNINDVMPNIRITKTVKKVVATYRVVISNESEAEEAYLSGLSDDKFGDLVTKGYCKALPELGLNPKDQEGASYECEFEQELIESPHKNTVSVTAGDNDGNFVAPTPADDAEVTFK